MQEDNNKQRILITGGMGFIGSHVVEHIHRHTKWDIVILDKLSYASKGFERIRSMGLMNSSRLSTFTFDFSQPITEGLALEMGDVNYIVHMAADTHVDNSINTPVPFILNNVMSTVELLEYARGLKNLHRFFYFSTDECLGPAVDGVRFKEWDVHNPTNPYSASKSASESICLAYENTYNVPVLITNTVNVYGERQLVEKFIPKVIQYVLEGKEIQIHSYPGCERAGNRFYIHARSVADAVLFLIKNGETGEKYNVCSDDQMDNLELALFIADVVGKPLKYKMVDWHTSERAGHDVSYNLCGEKMKGMGWRPPIPFRESLKKTVQWTLENQEWLE